VLGSGADVHTKTPHCPTCKAKLGTAPDAAAFPFCSTRCKLADLGNWLDGRYAVQAPATLSESLPADEEVLDLASELATRRFRS
jgi:uncharacterized protein